MATPVLAPQRSNDVTVYSRHIEGCKNKTAKKLRDCRCPKWLYVKATRKRTSARTISWETAETLAQNIRNSYDPTKRRLAELEAREARKTVALDEAVETWLNHKHADGVKESSVQTYRWTPTGFVAFAHKFGVKSLHEVNAPLMTEWKTQPVKESLSSKRKKRGHLRDFFRFCVENQKWLASGDNPATALTKIKGKDDISAVPFSQEQYERSSPPQINTTLR